MPLDKKSIVWGLLLSIVATGLYDTLKALMEGNYKEETIAVVATLIVVFVLFIAFYKQLLKEK
jgi:predicted PurR-regulated permease PerM